MTRAAEPNLFTEDESSLAARAAWLHHVGRLTQSEVATRLNVPNVKAHRLIARAGREGMVRVFIDGEIAQCMQLEQQLCRAYGLGFCEVAPNVDDEPLPLRSLGVLGARYLRLACEKGEDAVIGLGHGRTLAACIAHLPRIDVRKVRFVSLLGGFTRRFAANPFDVINRIVERTGAEAYVLPVPFCLNSAEDRAVLMAQRGIDAVFALARGSTLRFAGIGIVDGSGASLATSGMIEPQEFDEVARAGPRRDPGPLLRFPRAAGRDRAVGTARLAGLRGPERRQARRGRGRQRQARGDPRRVVERAAARPSHGREDGSCARRSEIRRIAGGGRRRRRRATRSGGSSMDDEVCHPLAACAAPSDLRLVDAGSRAAGPQGFDG